MSYGFRGRRPGRVAIFAAVVSVLAPCARAAGPPKPPRRPAVCVEDVEGLGAVLFPGSHRTETYCGGLPESPDPKGKRCSPQAEAWLFAPALWGPVVALHTDLKGDTSDYFEDDFFGGRDAMEVTIPGRGQGIETGRFAFYAGHGGPWGWTAGSGTSWLDRVFLGNHGLQYLVMCSCNVLAHGPACVPGAAGTCRPEFEHPDEFSIPSSFLADTADMRNVFFRWRSHLAPGLRLVCGGVTETCAGAAASARMWDRYLNHCDSPADAWMTSDVSGAEVRGCLTLGGKDPRETGLYDAAFGRDWSGAEVGAPEGEGPELGAGEFLHFQYSLSEMLRSFEDEEGGILTRLEKYFDGADGGGLKLPVLQVVPGALSEQPSASCPSQLPSQICNAAPGVPLERDLPFLSLRGPDWHAWVHTVSSSVHFQRPLGPPVADAKSPKGSVLGATAVAELNALGLAQALPGPGELAPHPESVRRIWIDRAARQGLGEDAARFLKASVVELRRYVDLCDGLVSDAACASLREAGLSRIPTVGAGGILRVVLDPKGDLASASRVWRPLVPGAESLHVTVLPFQAAVDQAYAELEARLSEAAGEGGEELSVGSVREIYSLDHESSTFGYVEHGPSCRQTELWPRYRLRFEPNPGAASGQDLSPILLEIHAVEADSGTSDCAPWTIEGDRVVLVPD